MEKRDCKNKRRKKEINDDIAKTKDIYQGDFAKEMIV